MPTEKYQAGHRAGPAPGALLLCRAEPGAVAPAAHLLRERMLLVGAGDDWSALVPEGRPWLHGGEPVDQVLAGWATALAVGAPWPVVALWWDADRAGCTLASGFRRPVGYVWLANGTPAGEDEAMRTFAARLGLDPVRDMRSMQALEQLTEPDPAADARARLRGLVAVLTRAGVSLPAGLAPGEGADRLREIARLRPDARHIEWPGWREAVRTERDAVDRSALGPWMAWSGDPRACLLGLTQVTVGLPVAAWGLRRRSGGWITAGALLLVHGALALAYGMMCPRD